MFTTDKVGHGYLPTYMSIIASLGIKPRILEVGIANGDGLRMFRTLSPHCDLWGVDINTGATWPEGVHKVITSQDSMDLVNAIPDDFDLIVDDASHHNYLTTTTLKNLWPKVVSKGYYIVEDWSHVSGICMQLATDLVRNFVDGSIIQDVESITYKDGLIILRKK